MIHLYRDKKKPSYLHMNHIEIEHQFFFEEIISFIKWAANVKLISKCLWFWYLVRYIQMVQTKSIINHDSRWNSNIKIKLKKIKTLLKSMFSEPLNLNMVNWQEAHGPQLSPEQ